MRKEQYENTLQIYLIKYKIMVKFKNRETGTIVNADMFFFEEYTDWGSMSFEDTLKAIQKDFEILI